MYLFNIRETLQNLDGTPFAGNPVSIQGVTTNTPIRLYTQAGLLISSSGHVNLDASGILDVYVGRRDLLRITVYHAVTGRVEAVLNGVKPLTMEASGGTLTGYKPPGIGSDFDIYDLPDESSISTSDYLPVSGGSGANARMSISDLIALVPGGGGGGTYPELDSFQNADSASIIFGAPVYSPTTGQAMLAQGNTAGRKVVGLHADNVPLAPGGSGNFLAEGTLVGTSTQWQAVTGMSGGLVPGARYYLDIFTPGKLYPSFSTAGAPIGSYIVPVGYALNANEFVFSPQPVIRVA